MSDNAVRVVMESGCPDDYDAELGAEPSAEVRGLPREIRIPDPNGSNAVVQVNVQTQVDREAATRSQATFHNQAQRRALAQLQAQLRAQAQVHAQTQAQLREQLQAQAELQARLQEQLQSQAQLLAQLQEQLQAHDQAQARRQEQQAQAQADLQAQLQAQAKAQAHAQAQLHAQLLAQLQTQFNFIMLLVAKLQADELDGQDRSEGVREMTDRMKSSTTNQQIDPQHAPGEGYDNDESSGDRSGWS